MVIIIRIELKFNVILDVLLHTVYVGREMERYSTDIKASLLPLISTESAKIKRYRQQQKCHDCSDDVRFQFHIRRRFSTGM